MASLSIKNMSIEEKLSTMELLWNDLCQHHTAESPIWHQDVLQSRDTRRSAGQDQPENWNEAKKHILKQTQ